MQETRRTWGFLPFRKYVFLFVLKGGGGGLEHANSALMMTNPAATRGPNFTQLYVNGQLESQTNVSFAQDYGSFPLFFGSSGQSYWDRKFNGLLDEVSLYNRALSSNEIAAISAAGSAGKCGPPHILAQPQSQITPHPRGRNGWQQAWTATAGLPRCP